MDVESRSSKDPYSVNIQTKHFEMIRMLMDKLTVLRATISKMKKVYVERNDKAETQISELRTEMSKLKFSNIQALSSADSLANTRNSRGEVLQILAGQHALSKVLDEIRTKETVLSNNSTSLVGKQALLDSLLGMKDEKIKIDVQLLELKHKIREANHKIVYFTEVLSCMEQEYIQMGKNSFNFADRNLLKKWIQKMQFLGKMLKGLFQKNKEVSERRLKLSKLIDSLLALYSGGIILNAANHNNAVLRLFSANATKTPCQCRADSAAPGDGDGREGCIACIGTELVRLGCDNLVTALDGSSDDISKIQRCIKEDNEQALIYIEECGARLSKVVTDRESDYVDVTRIVLKNLRKEQQRKERERVLLQEEAVKQERDKAAARMKVLEQEAAAHDKDMKRLGSKRDLDSAVHAHERQDGRSDHSDPPGQSSSSARPHSPQYLKATKLQNILQNIKEKLTYSDLVKESAVQFSSIQLDELMKLSTDFTSVQSVLTENSQTLLAQISHLKKDNEVMQVAFQRQIQKMQAAVASLQKSRKKDKAQTRRKAEEMCAEKDQLHAEKQQLRQTLDAYKIRCKKAEQSMTTLQSKYDETASTNKALSMTINAMQRKDQEKSKPQRSNSGSMLQNSRSLSSRDSNMPSPTREVGLAPRFAAGEENRLPKNSSLIENSLGEVSVAFERQKTCNDLIGSELRATQLALGQKLYRLSVAPVHLDK